MVAELVALPSSLVERVAIDRVKKLVYVDRRYAGDPLLLTWQDRNKSNGNILILKPVDVDEVAKFRAGGMREAEGVDVDMMVRGHAIEIIRQAAAYGASDIHLMLRGEHTEIQIVVKGGLRVLARKSQAEGEALTRAIYQGIAKTRDASYNTMEFQNAQIPGDALPPDAGLTSIRIVRGPCYPQAQDGAFMTMRLQYCAVQSGTKRRDLPPLALPRQPEGELELVSMGYTAKQVDKLKRLMDAPNGVVIFTGPTGSGKTTAMFEALKDIARAKPQRRLVTVEDPVEYPMDWAVQMAVTGARNDAETGAAFGERIRVALRMAPNIILLGELRGPDVAVAALEAAVTGHQVWTTMHVTDPFLFVERLELMDRTRLERRVFCDHKIVRGVIAQRLLPRLCPNCSTLLSGKPSVLPGRVITALETWGDIDKVRVQGDGCGQCGHDGTLDRFAVAEVLVMDAAVMRDFIKHGSEVARDNYRANPDADPSMLESAITHALSGTVDPRAVEDWVDLIEPKDRRRNRDSSN
jgi:general secretion pathway protein E